MELTNEVFAFAKKIEECVTGREAGNDKPRVFKLGVLNYRELILGKFLMMLSDGEGMIAGVRLDISDDIWICGPPAMGKSRLGAQLSASLNRPLIELDRLASRVNTKWIIDVPKLRVKLHAIPAAVVAGNADNLTAVAATIDPSLVIFPIPPLNTFKAICEMKAGERLSRGKDDDFTHSLQLKSKYGSSEYYDYVAKKVCQYSKIIMGYGTHSFSSRFALVFTPEGDVFAPWHEYGGKIVEPSSKEKGGTL